MFWRIIFFILIASYPFMVFIGLNHFEPRMVSLLLLVVALFYFFSKNANFLIQKNIIIFFILAIVLCTQIFNKDFFIKLYPIFVSSIFLFSFLYTLFIPPSMIERFARLTNKDLPEKAILYTKNVTIVWCLFFIINIAISLYTTFFCSLKVWTLYNGFLSYLFMGILFILEYIIRYFVKTT